MFERTLVLRALIHCLPLLSTSQVHLPFKAQLKCLLLQAGFEDPNYSSSQAGISSAREWVNPTLGADWWLNPTMGGWGKLPGTGTLNWPVKEKGFQPAVSMGIELCRKKEEHARTQGCGKGLSGL